MDKDQQNLRQIVDQRIMSNREGFVTVLAAFYRDLLKEKMPTSLCKELVRQYFESMLNPSMIYEEILPGEGDLNDNND